jgi:hypothetical protein
MKRILVALMAALTLGLAGCGSFGETRELEFKVEPTLPEAIQEVQKQVLRGHAELAAAGAAIGKSADGGTLSKAQAQVLLDKVKAVREGLVKVQDLIDARKFVEASTEFKLKATLIKLLQREVAQELAKQAMKEPS